MSPKNIILAMLVAGVCAVGTLLLLTHYSGPFPQPIKTLWDVAYFVGVMVSGNAHQPNGIAIAGVFFVLFFVIGLLVLVLTQRGK